MLTLLLCCLHDFKFFNKSLCFVFFADERFHSYWAQHCCIFLHAWFHCELWPYMAFREARSRSDFLKCWIMWHFSFSSCRHERRLDTSTAGGQRLRLRVGQQRTTGGNRRTASLVRSGQHVSPTVADRSLTPLPHLLSLSPGSSALPPLSIHSFSLFLLLLHTGISLPSSKLPIALSHPPSPFSHLLLWFSMLFPYMHIMQSLFCLAKYTLLSLLFLYIFSLSNLTVEILR